MNDPGKSEFDRYAAQYTELHRASIAASGEEPAYFSRYKARYMARAVGRAKAESALRILDFGCGVGNSMPPLRDAFPRAELCGVDPSTESIRLAGEQHAGVAQFKANDGQVIPHPGHSFDLVQVACVLHHIPPAERVHWMQEIHRVLRPGGRVFVFEHNVLNPLTLKAVRDCPFDEDAILLPRRELLGLAVAAGFNHVRNRYIVFFPAALSLLRPLEPVFGHVPLGAQYVVCATA
jgi:SAM-dependent methyltransferase